MPPFFDTIRRCLLIVTHLLRAVTYSLNRTTLGFVEGGFAYGRTADTSYLFHCLPKALSSLELSRRKKKKAG